MLKTSPLLVLTMLHESGRAHLKGKSLDIKLIILSRY